MLREAQVSGEAHGPLAPIQNKLGAGSAVEVHFRGPMELAAARVAVRAAHKEFVPGRIVWLEERQIAVEAAAAAKAVHHLADAVRDVEAERTAPAQVTKDMASRSIWVAQTRIAFISKGDVHWTAAGRRR